MYWLRWHHHVKDIAGPPYKIKKKRKQTKWQNRRQSVVAGRQQTDTDQNISARSLTLLIFAVWWALCGRPQPEYELVDATTVIFFIKCFNQLKLYPLSGNIFRKFFTSYFLFINEHLIRMVNLIAVTTLFLTSSLHCCQQRIFKTNTNDFMLLESAFH